MGVLKNGILGPVQGKVAHLVGYDLNGQAVLRSIGANTKPLSEKQMNNNEQMAVIMGFFERMDTLLKTGFTPKASGTTLNYHNVAIKLNKPHALKGFYPNVEVDFAKIVISAGDLPQPVSPTMMLENGQIDFTWGTTDLKWPENTDRVMLLAYSPELKDHEFVYSGAMRHEGKESLKIPAQMESTLMHVYISFVSDDRTKASDSLYMGTIGG